MTKEETKLQDLFEKNNFIVHLFEQDGKQCAEVETWTEGGVNMISTLTPFTAEEFKECVECFSVDEEIDLHRQDPKYKDAFTISQSLKDFTNFHKRLKKVAAKL